VLLCLAGSGLVLISAGQVWAQVAADRPAPLPALDLAVTGRELTAVPAALGLVGLAGTAALVAARRWGRVAVGLVLALAGVAVAVRAAQIGAGLAAAVQRAGVLDDEQGAPLRIAAAPATIWPGVCAVGGLLLALAGLLAVLRGPRWASLGRKYEAPGRAPSASPPGTSTAQRHPDSASPERPARQRAARDPEVAAWDALDRGDDPTR